MKDWRNPELKGELLMCGVAVLLLAALCLPLAPGCIPAILVTGLLMSLLHWGFVHRRYREIAALSQSLDRILHGQGQVLEDNAEGELAILRSEICKMTLRLKETTDQLQADKLDLAREMADISHQIRTPLTSMNLTVSLLAREGGDERRRLSLTRELKRSLERIDWLVETLLKLSRLEAGVVVFEPSCISAAELTERAVRNLCIPMELRGQNLKLELGDVRLTADPAWTAEALGNVVKNCVEHTPAGGTVSIAARQTPVFTELTVTDTGPGIEPEDLPHLFERFYRGKQAGAHSVGIGLALARQILAAQNASIRVENAPRGGAKFTLRFYVEII